MGYHITWTPRGRVYGVVSRWSVGSRQVCSLLTIMCILSVLCSTAVGDHAQQLDVVVDNMTFCNALLDYNYIHPRTKTLERKADIRARYGASSACRSDSGVMVHVEDDTGENHGCTPHTGKLPTRKWIALVERGQCQFDQKIKHATQLNNASAIVVYNNKDENDIPIMYHMVSGMIAVFIHKADGEELAGLVDRGVRVHLHIRAFNMSASLSHQGHGSADGPGSSEVSSSSGQQGLGHGLGDAATRSSGLLYVSLSLVVVLIGGLGALLVFGLYRARSAHPPPPHHPHHALQRQHQNGHHRHHPCSSSIGNTRVVYAENGEVHGYLVEQPLASPNRQQQQRSNSRRAPPAPVRTVYTTIVEEDEEEDDA